MIFKTGVGAWTVYAIEDGWFFRDPVDMFPGSDPDAWTPDLLAEGRLRISAGCFLLAGKGDLVLIDSGFGAGAEPFSPDGEVGRLPAALARLRVDPGEIGTILHTHLHPDHIGGDVTSEGKLAFPSATVVAHSREVDYWTEDDRLGSRSHLTFQPVLDSGRVRTLDRDTEVVAGLTMIETFGHTPGHMSVLVSSRRQRHLIVTGDVTHHPLQVRHPDWGIAADVDRSAGIVTRKALFARIVDEGLIMAAGHYPRPGFGHIISEDGREAFAHAAVGVID